jgi:hypothetical protein
MREKGGERERQCVCVYVNLKLVHRISRNSLKSYATGAHPCAASPVSTTNTDYVEDVGICLGSSYTTHNNTANK